MSDQGDLFTPYPAKLYDGHPPHEESDTSLIAASEIKQRANAMRARVLAYLRNCGEHGATDNEIQNALNMIGSTERPRRRELVLLGKVEDSAQRRASDAGKLMTVWRVTVT